MNSFSQANSRNPHRPFGDGGQPPGGNRRPIQPQPVSYTSSWLRFLVVLFLAIAWIVPIKFLVDRLMWPQLDRGPHDSHQFAVLAYEGVSDKPNEVNPAQFRDHLDSLREAGYVPVTMEEVRLLFVEDRPLPSRAVLLTFDHSRKTSYFQTKRALRRTGWNAVMFLWTGPMADRDPATLLWPYVRNMVRAPSWEIGAQSHQGFQQVPASPSGRTGNFMTSPIWLPGENRFEAPEEFQERLLQDQQYNLDIIARETGTRPAAYAYPFGDFGQYHSRAIVTRAINLAIVENHYDLGFIAGNLAINTRHNDPRRLNRLQVPGDWSGSDLVARLDREWPQGEPFIDAAGRMEAASWIVDWGSMEQLPNNDLLLYAPPGTTGAKTWLAGSNLSKDFYSRVRFKLDQGQLGIYLRASADGEAFTYLGIDSGGGVWLRQMGPGERSPEAMQPQEMRESGVWLRQKTVTADRFTLASSRVPIALRKEQELELFLRDRMIFARLNGEEIFRQRVLLRGPQNPGLFGFSVWDPTPGAARVRISDVALHPQKPSISRWSPELTAQPHTIKWIHENSYRLTAISPLWMRATGIERVEYSDYDPRIYEMLSEINHLGWYPEIRVDHVDGLNRLAPALLAEKIGEQGADGLLLDLAVRGRLPIERVADWLQQCHQALHDADLQFLLRVPREIGRHASLHSLLALLPGAKIVVTEASELQEAVIDERDDVIKAENIPPPSPEDELPLSYMIPTLPGAATEETVEVRIQRLHRNGLAAFMEGSYERAVEYWREWLELEPGNSQALMLLGDAHARTGDFELAADYYRQSLEIDPGQIPLALRQANLLRRIGNDDQALQLLNLYGRLFPDNPLILATQAQWLIDYDRRREARRLAEQIVRIAPDNVIALGIMAALAEPGSDDFDHAVRKLADAAGNEEQLEDLARVILRHDLLSMAGSRPLLQAIRELDPETSEQAIPLLQRIKPRAKPMHSAFNDGNLGGEWRLEGGGYYGDPGRIHLAANNPYTELTLRLNGSMHLRDSFVEAEVEEVRGNFWLFVRRTHNGLARFGLTEDGRCHLQIWHNGRMLTSHERQWQGELPATLRLESRAGGLMGYIDGEPAFGTRLHFPSAVQAGWSGLALHDHEPGRAAATIRSLNGGLLRARLAMLPPAADPEQLLPGLGSRQARLTSVCPAWYTVDSGGDWHSAVDEPDLLRMFTRYHRIWLMPSVRLDDADTIAARDLLRTARDGRLDGFTIVSRNFPSENVIEELEQQLYSSGLKILWLRTADDEGDPLVRGIGDGMEIIGGHRDPAPAVMIDGMPRPVEDLPGAGAEPLVFRLPAAASQAAPRDE